MRGLWLFVCILALFTGVFIKVYKSTFCHASPHLVFLFQENEAHMTHPVLPIFLSNTLKNKNHLELTISVVTFN